MSSSSPTAMRFGPYRLDLRAERLWHGDRAIVLRPKSWQVLRHLAEHPGELVTVSQLLDAVWSGTAVTPNVLTNVIGELRRALDDQAQAPAFIETVHRRGYRFVGAIEIDGAGGEPSAVAAPVDPVLVGREAERSRLAARWADACSGTRAVVFVAGEPGIGKTTLVDAFVAPLATDGGVQVVRAQCIDQLGAGEPYMPVLDVLERLAADVDRDGYVALLRQFAPTCLAQIPGLLPPDEMQALRQSLAGAGEERMLRESVAAFEAVAARRPLLVVLEDLHWADRATLDVVAALAQRTGPARLMALLTYRPVDAVARNHPVVSIAHRLRLHRHADVVMLAPFTADEVRTYLDRRFGGTAASQLADLTEEHSAGNPLFVSALMAHLVEHGWLRCEGGSWALAADLAGRDLGWPDDLRATIESQLTALPPEIVALLEAASVEGEEFSVDGAAAGVEQDVEAVEDLLHDTAVRWGLVLPAGAKEWPDGRTSPRYRFRHALYRRGVHARIPPARRRRLHQRVGELLERVWSTRAGDVATQLAEHFEAADDVERRVRYRAMAGATAAARFVPAEAAPHFAEAIAQLRRLPETPERHRRQADLELSLGNMIGMAHGFQDPRVREAYTRAEAAARAGAAHRERFRALFGLGSVCSESGDAIGYQPLVNELVAMAESVVPTLAGQAYARAGEAAFVRGELAEARRQFERSLVSPAEPGIPVLTDARSMARASLGLVATLLGDLPLAADALAAASNGADAAGPLNRCSVIWLAMLAATLRRDRDAVVRFAAETNAIADRHAIPTYSGMANWTVSESEDPPSVRTLEAVGAGFDADARIGRWHQTMLFGRLAERWLEIGRASIAQIWIDRAFESVERLGQRWYEAELWRLVGEAMLAGVSANAPVAETHFRRAIAIAETQQARLFGLRATISLARLLGVRGERAEARERLATTVEGFHGDAVDLVAARALLDQLS